MMIQPKSIEILRILDNKKNETIEIDVKLVYDKCVVLG